MLNPDGASEGEADYFVEIIVDVLGTWRSRTDWAISNNEQLKAITSFEYVITPMKNQPNEKRIVGRVAYEAEYSEQYVFWMGPTSSNTVVKITNIADIIPDFGEGVSDFSNLKRAKPVEFAKPDAPVPIQINPQIH